MSAVAKSVAFAARDISRPASRSKSASSLQGSARNRIRTYTSSSFNPSPLRGHNSGGREFGGRARCTAEEVALLPAGLPMHWQWSGQVQSLHVSIDAAVASGLLADPGTGEQVELLAAHLLDDRVVSHLLQRLRMDAVGNTDPLRVEHTTQQLLTRVRIGTRRAPTHSLPPQRLNQVLDWIDAHLGEPISPHRTRRHRRSRDFVVRQALLPERWPAALPVRAASTNQPRAARITGRHTASRRRHALRIRRSEPI